MALLASGCIRRTLRSWTTASSGLSQPPQAEAVATTAARPKNVEEAYLILGEVAISPVVEYKDLTMQEEDKSSFITSKEA